MRGRRGAGWEGEPWVLGWRVIGTITAGKLKDLHYDENEMAMALSGLPSGL